MPPENLVFSCTTFYKLLEISFLSQPSMRSPQAEPVLELSLIVKFISTGTKTKEEPQPPPSSSSAENKNQETATEYQVIISL